MHRFALTFALTLAACSEDTPVTIQPPAQPTPAPAESPPTGATNFAPAPTPSGEPAPVAPAAATPTPEAAPLPAAPAWPEPSPGADRPGVVGLPSGDTTTPPAPSAPSRSASGQGAVPGGPTAPVAVRPLPEPAAAPSQATRSAPPAVTTHTVRKGESLTSIAATYNLRPVSLAAWNDHTLADPLWVGEKLTIEPVQDGSWRVRRGQSLLGIGAVLGVDARSLAAANGIANLDHIEVGQRLVIPGPIASR